MDLIFLSTPSARRATSRGKGTAAHRRNFYPRPPRGGRPGCGTPGTEHRRISIHALREEGDAPSFSVWASSFLFLSTPSARRATASSWPGPIRRRISIHALREEGDETGQPNPNDYTISIHALREEGDVLRFRRWAGPENFYPRPPRGGRPAGIHRPCADHSISIHALREEGDYPRSAPDLRPAQISIHALREEGDRSTS